MNKENVITFIAEKINKDPYYSLENFALHILQEKIVNNSASSAERLLLINDFISHYLEFDVETGEPIGRTLEIEEMIDFLLKGD